MPAINQQVVQRFFDQVVNRGDLEALEELMAPDDVEHGNPSGSGIDGFKRFVPELGAKDQKSPVSQGVEMATVPSRDGTPIAFRRSGSGPPLVLVHGAMADHSRWLPLIGELEARFTVYAVDRRGRGASGDTPPYSLGREVDDILAVVEAIGEPADLLAHSFGAFCSLEAALRTDQVRRLVLYEPPPPGVPGTLRPEVEETLERMLEAGDHEGLVSTFLLQVAGIQPREIEVMRSLPAWQRRVAAAPTILREIRALESAPPLDPGRYRSLRIPTLLLVGGDSGPAYRQVVDQLYSALPDGRVVVLAGQQHVAMDTAPELFLSEVLAFLTAGDTQPPVAADR